MTLPKPLKPGIIGIVGGPAERDLWGTLGRLAELGYEGIEGSNLLDLSADAAPQTLRRLNELGLSLLTVSTNRQEVREDLDAVIARGGRRAGDAGDRLVGSGGRPGRGAGRRRGVRPGGRAAGPRGRPPRLPPPRPRVPPQLRRGAGLRPARGQHRPRARRLRDRPRLGRRRRGGPRRPGPAAGVAGDEPARQGLRDRLPRRRRQGPVDGRRHRVRPDRRRLRRGVGGRRRVGGRRAGPTPPPSTPWRRRRRAS